ncbi:MAG TPA: FHA domain-containing protein, partial [Aggregatilineales bacterium]|nr:FHA domain-containing protein [Aggregatilineales bacterium]
RDYRAVAEKTQMRWQVRGHLVVIANETTSPAPGTTLPLAPATTLGRAPGNTIQIDDRFASNEHARVVQRLGRWWLEDQHSRNGTRLNGVPVEEPVVLSSGDVISIGSVDLRLELD